MSRLVWSRANVVLLVCSTLGSMILGAVGGEVAVRYRERHRTMAPGTMPFLFYQHQRLRTALVHGADYFGWVRTDRQGFRGPEVSLEKSAGVLRVMAVGSSTTFGGQSVDDRTWPSRLQAKLNAIGPVEVINAGIPGYSILDDIVRLQSELYQYRPDIIVLYEGHNDLFVGLQRGVTSRDEDWNPRPGQVEAVSPWFRWLTEHSLLAAKVRASLVIRSNKRAERRKTQIARPSLADWDRTLADVADDFGRNLRAFLAVAGQLGIPVVLPALAQVSGPDTVEADPRVRAEWQQAVIGVPADIVLQGYRRVNDRMREVAMCFGMPFVPPESLTVKGPEFYAEGDLVHFNDAGAERFSDQLAAFFQRRGLLDTRRRPVPGPSSCRPPVPGDEKSDPMLRR